MIRPILILLSTGLLPGAAPAFAQQIPEVRLSRADARFEEPFSSITGFRPLPDGRVLVTDGIDGTFLRLDLRAGKADTIGRAGAGPGEYRIPDALFAIEGGNTLLVDLGNGRLSVFDGTGKYLESMPIASGDPGRGLTMRMPRATDAQGRIYYRPGPGAGAGSADSGAIIRYDRKRDAVDTVARVGLAAMKVNTSGGANNRSVRTQAIPYSPEDAWAVGPDGRVAVARAADYHVEWITPDGRAVKGPSVQVRTVPVREADKTEWLEAMANGLTVQARVENGQVNVQFGRGRPGGQQPDVSDFEWPASKPAFTGGMWISAEGEVWVERSVPAGQPRIYDVFGGDARRVRTVTVPSDRRVLGFGPGVVYVRRTDPDDGLQYLERYTLTGSVR